MHVLVHKDRDLGPVAEVRYPQGQVIEPLAGSGYGGATVTVNWNSPDVDVRRDDWVMMRNYNSSIQDAGYRDQVGFYRVTGVFGNTLTLDGADFSFDWADNSGTQIYHLVGLRDGKRSGQVISVYERTTEWEQKSNWN